MDMPYVYRNPVESELFQRVFGDLNIGYEAKNLFEVCRKGSIIHAEHGTYGLPNFQDYLKDKYRLDGPRAYAIYWYLVLTTIWRMKPKDAIHELANEMK